MTTPQDAFGAPPFQTAANVLYMAEESVLYASSYGELCGLVECWMEGTLTATGLATEFTRLRVAVKEAQDLRRREAAREYRAMLDNADAHPMQRHHGNPEIEKSARKTVIFQSRPGDPDIKS